MSDIAAIILAAGKGTRFQSETINKVAIPLSGKPIIAYGVELLEKVGIHNIFVVVGFAKESIQKALVGHKVTFVEQKEQKGTADALASALTHISSTVKDILVLNGDDPFQKTEIILSCIEKHKASGAAITFAITNLSNPKGMGRIIRDSNGKLEAIIEEKDATIEQKAIKEVNGACYLFSLSFLREYLPALAKSQVTGEYYITDLIKLAVANNEKVETVVIEGKWKGINTPQDLKEAESLINNS